MISSLKNFFTSKVSVNHNSKVRRDLQTARTALYVDTENLQGGAREIIRNIIRRWPEGNPPLSKLNLYVVADRVALWEMWASSQFPQLTVTVKGIQHFSHRQSKNSADIAIAIDAIADFVTGETQYLAVMSDDSDFMPLYAKLKAMTKGRVPFLWLVTDRVGTRSSTIKEYFPNDHIHVVGVPTHINNHRIARDATARVAVARDVDGANSPRMGDIVNLIIHRIPVGPFKSTDCQPLISSQWPNHPMATLSSGRFGSEFANKVWPLLERRKVILQRIKPRKYEMTLEAKRPGSATSDPELEQ